jgi:hypothetical protein
MNKISAAAKAHRFTPATKPRITAVEPVAPAPETEPVEPATLFPNPPEAIVKHDFVTTTTDGASQWFEFMLRRAREHGIFMVRETLTGALARLLLDNNEDNRPISAMKVMEMAQDMRNGTFDSMNGQTIHITEGGLLNDGQHRCHARLEALVDLPFHFIFGLKREARLTIDQGRPRTASDYLKMSGYEGGAKAAAIGYLLFQWRERNKRLGDPGGRSKNRLSVSQRAQYVRDHFDQIIASVNAVGNRPGLAAVGGYGLIGFAHLLLAEKHFVGATEFITRLITGSELAETSPISRCRNRLLTEKRLTREERLELIIRAWNAWRRNDAPKVVPITGRIPEILD